MSVTIRRLASLVAAFAVVAALLSAGHQAPAQKRPAEREPAKGAESHALNDAVEAYIRFLPRHYMRLLERTRTRFKEPTTAGAPTNQFAPRTALADPSLRGIVRPNSDTLYASAWLDLSREPLVLRTPDTGGRYHLVQVMDLWTEVVASVGTRTTGNKEYHCALVGPGWRGTLPKGLEAHKAPGNLLWLLTRVLVEEPGEVNKVAELLLGYTLTPLSRYRKGGALKRSPPPKEVAPGRGPSLADYTAFLARHQPHRLLEMMREAVRDPLTVRDKKDEEVLARLEGHLGRARAEFDGGGSAQPTVAALTLGVRAARDVVAARYHVPGPGMNGWRLLLAGRWKEDCLRRAVVAEYLLAANLPEDAVYPEVTLDQWGAPLTGERRYVLHFDKGQVPPVAGFWSLTTYDLPGLMLVPNPLKRYCLGSHRKGLKSNPDGSLDIYLQHRRLDKAHESNWLPTPAGPFNLTLRCFLPHKPLLDGTYKYPVVRRVD
jgi:hypothetical protein